MDGDEEKERFKGELKLFCGADEKLARAAFDRFSHPSRRYLYALLRDKFSRDDQEEIVQITLVKAWKHRNAFTNHGRAAWFGWLAKIARHTCIDRIRGTRTEIPIDLLTERDDGDLPFIELVMTNALGREYFYLADVDLLGLDATLTPSEQDRRLLAAQYFYLHDWSAEELLEHLSETRPDSPPVSHAQLCSWLEAPGTLRYLAYQELYFSPERLTAYLLRMATDSTAGDLERALTTMRAARTVSSGLGGWTCLETQAILWRYYRGLTADEMARHIDSDTNINELESIFERCGRMFPFTEQMEKVCRWLDNLDFLKMERPKLIGGESGLWYRLVFEYRYRHSLPLKDIHQRVYSAASLVPYEITLDMLNTWLSGGRLLNRLRRYYEKRHSE